MPTTTFTFGTDLNTSITVGDILYYAPTTSSGGFNVSPQSNIVEVGNITAINFSAKTVVCNVSNLFYVDTSNLPYMFFGKDNRINSGSLIGYFAKIQFTNNSKEKGDNKGEMFTASCDIFESSK